MSLFVALFALVVAWFALVRSRQADDAVRQLRRDVSKLTQRQQQLLRQQQPAEGPGPDAAEDAAPAQQASAAPEDMDVEEIELTEPAR